MPAARNALALCTQTRQWVGVYDRSVLRNGFADDLGMADLDCITALNWAIKQLLPTGQIKCYFTLPVVANQSQYELDTAIGTVVVATWTDSDGQIKPLAKTKITSLDMKYPGWRNAEPGIPVAWHTDVPDVIELIPAPDASDAEDAPSLTLLAEAISNDLALPTDIPSRLPVQFHEDLCIGAAMRICFSMTGDNPIMMQKYLELKALWAEVILRVQQNANNREQDESYQMAPRDTYRNISGGFPNAPFAAVAGDTGDW